MTAHAGRGVEEASLGDRVADANIDAGGISEIGLASLQAVVRVGGVDLVVREDRLQTWRFLAVRIEAAGLRVWRHAGRTRAESVIAAEHIAPAGIVTMLVCRPCPVGHHLRD